ncbi:4-(cytidine 5'-diphospho)-2-C-methyl-D-erythritol kinase [Desulfotomaculum copahuensis]|uniref:4-diphosphocytidyl-2-C-methyl-D-erythritol kinase n=1 Tax=Desulfotomaculum copahuensis TaxID=1838280 RepID=A0A1B7LFM6_9FIRM|nr:4-(cytidine 5'-diphospho)-2-C-methyl-D-erythritol kinase [Desulfotomaculum copahuensis]OAT82945.1 4-(cytidine 5'-diphospho)-2-C-methyl-D-erythritol kinase [Desulfotomaculum copahuensis]
MLELAAHAKINLSLDIKGRRADGYHELETVMQSIALHDRLVFSAAADGAISLECDSGEVPAGPENLVYRAALLLRENTRCRRGVRISLAKRIPVAAGLGGGSADAAAALAGLNRFWNLGLPPAVLCSLAAVLGADVPFCLRGGTALARGKGELLTPLPALPAMGVVLAKPPFGVSTARVYAAYDQRPAGPGPDTAAMLAAIEQRDPAAVARCLGNVLEPVTASLHPVINDIRRALLRAGAMNALMSGSGPAVFGLCRDEREAGRVAARLTDVPGKILVTRLAGNCPAM